MEKMNPRWEYGVFVGVRADSGDLWVATKGGLQAVRSVRRLPLEERWRPDNREYVKPVPWNRSGDDPNADGDLPEEVEIPAGGAADAAGVAGAARVVLVNTREAVPKDFYIKKRDVEAHGHTKGCAGCRTMFHGGTRQNHSADCRERFRGLLQNEARVQRMADKRKEYEAKLEEEAQRREDRKKRKVERKAEKRGRKRRAEDDALEEERILRPAQAEGEDEEIRPAPPQDGDGRAPQDGDGRAGSSGDGIGMEIEVVTGGGDAVWDDVRGGWLNIKDVQKARKEEVDYMKKERLWDEVPRGGGRAADCVGQVGRHEQRHGGFPGNPLQVSCQGIQGWRPGP